ncbi:hypothetical protein NPIL_200753 [Nephila pilipes]|uniref:Sodium/hydrogen exchanger 10 n=1 Tax=Nephila pilipes TaxID=299642 RepID=A0A8X6NFX5_NEPPI|nr:hypothetical protein NPIL_200753 [Nephila pilipes]
MGTIALLRRTEMDTDMEVTFTFCIAYLTYYICEVSFRVSGVLSVVVLGVCISSYKSSVNYNRDESSTVHQFWETLSFWANTLIFTIVGVIIASTHFKSFGATDIGLIFATYVAITLIRLLMIEILSPILETKGYGFSGSYAAVLTWGGLRGAVGLALVLIAQHSIPPNIARQLLTQVSGNIFLTLVFNAPTMRILLEVLGIGQVSAKNVKYMTQAVNLLRNVVNMNEKVIRMDKHMTGVDWMWVRSVTHIKNPYEKMKDVQTEVPSAFEADRGQCPKCKSEIKIEPNEEETRALEEDSRFRILRAFEQLPPKDRYLMTEDISETFLVIGGITQYVKNVMMKIRDSLRIEDRQSMAKLYLTNLQEDISGFRKWCLASFISEQHAIVLFWVMLLNVIPIAAEIATFVIEKRKGNETPSEKFVKEFTVFESLNTFAMCFYIYDTTNGIMALGFREYFHSHGNKIDFFVTIVVVVQAIFFIVGVSALRLTYPIIYATITLSCLRLLRLLRVIFHVLFTTLLDEVCSVIYNAYDFAIGFIVANDMIVKNAFKTLVYEPSADLAQFTAENNIAQALSHLDDLDTNFPEITSAWKTQRATVYVLRDMKHVVEKMFEIYMLDENDADVLLEDINVKINDALCAPRHMPVKTEIRDLMKNVSWIENEDMLDMIMASGTFSTFSEDDVIQETGVTHPDVKIITSGILQISGVNDERKYNMLPNTDSLLYFIKGGSFCDYLTAPESIGILGYLQRTNSATTAICMKKSQLMNVSYSILEEAENQFGDLSYRIWRPIAIKIAQIVLEEEEVYEYWTEERIKIHLEEGIFPDLQGMTDFNVHEAIKDMVLIQGRVEDSDTDIVYEGPAYIPSAVRRLKLIDDPAERPRVIMILLREERYHSQTIMGWIKPNDISYKGLCLVHGIRRASLYGIEQIKEALGAHRSSFVQTLGQIFTKPKDGSILQSDTP